MATDFITCTYLPECNLAGAASGGVEGLSGTYGLCWFLGAAGLVLPSPCITHALRWSMQGRCSASIPAEGLEVTQAEIDGLTAVKPGQCVVLVDNTWLMFNNGTLWLDNVYVKVTRQKTVPNFAFITAGVQVGTERDGIGSYSGLISGTKVYLTRVTFHSEQQHNAVAVSAVTPSASFLISGAHHVAASRG